MSGNSFGDIFRITTWGESHGDSIGVVIDGCPPGIPISTEEINQTMLSRSPGNSEFTSARQEDDLVEILSGTFRGKTSGTPISLRIKNCDVKSDDYNDIEDKLRPGHGQLTYWMKYGIVDHRGGGRSSARETACRVAAGAVAKKIIALYGIDSIAFVKQIGHISINDDYSNIDIATTRKLCRESDINCPQKDIEKLMKALLKTIYQQGNSIGGIVGFVIENPPCGLGDPVFDKFQASLAKAMISIPGAKGFDIGKGFDSATMTGTEFNDIFSVDDDRIITTTNNCGGVLGGISTGMNIYGKVAFKPASTITCKQQTITTTMHNSSVKISKKIRRDVCIAIRGAPVVEAMCNIVTADFILKNTSNKICT